MIICPACKEQIEDDSLYCDQCGQQLLFCKQCGHVGLGRRCTRCGGVMALPQGSGMATPQEPSISVAPAAPVSRPNITPVSRPDAAPVSRPNAAPVSPISIISSASVASAASAAPKATTPPPASPVNNNVSNMSAGPNIAIAQAGSARTALPMMTLVNESLNLRISAMNGAVIGRRMGPYVQYFQQHSYVSGVHAQLKYKAGAGWCVIDKNSSNGTRVNQNLIQPDVETPLKNGDVLTIANINLQVIIR